MERAARIRSEYGVEKAGPRGLPGVPSSSFGEMPEDGFRCMFGRRAWTTPFVFGNVLHSLGEESCGGENGPRATPAAALAELARRVRAFSARSALKKNSSGDSSLRGTTGGKLDESFSSESVDGGEGS